MLKPRARKVLDWVVGSTLILFGIAAGPIPLLQGWLFVLAGLAVLSSHSPWARKLHETFQQFGRRVRQKIWTRRVESSTRDGRDDEK